MGLDIEHLYAGKNFNPEVGFVRRPRGFGSTQGKFRVQPTTGTDASVRKLFSRRRSTISPTLVDKDETSGISRRVQGPLR